MSFQDESVWHGCHCIKMGCNMCADGRACVPWIVQHLLEEGSGT